MVLGKAFWRFHICFDVVAGDRDFFVGENAGDDEKAFQIEEEFFVIRHGVNGFGKCRGFSGGVYHSRNLLTFRATVETDCVVLGYIAPVYSA